MQRVDRATVVALQLRAPRSSTYDAGILRGKMLSGEIFSAFSDHERNVILERVQTVQGLIPSFDDFFANLYYLAALANCLKWLTPISRGETLTKAMRRIFFDADGTPRHSTMETAGNIAVPTSAILAQRIAFGYRSLIVFAMKNYRRLPKKPSSKELLAKPIAEVDKTLLGEFAHLARNLGFNSPEINEIQSFTGSANTETVSIYTVPLLVTNGPGVPKKNRSGMPHVQEYSDERQLLSLDHLHLNTEEVGEGITSFFVRKDIYLSFFGEWNPNETIVTAQERTRQTPRATAQTQQQAHLRHQTIELENLERERLARLEQFRLEQEQLEREMLQRRGQLDDLEQRMSEQEKQLLLRETRLEQLTQLEQEKLEQERVARMEEERREQAKQKKEIQEQSRRKQERQEQRRRKHEKRKQGRLEQERLEQKKSRLAQEEEKQIEKERVKQEWLALEQEKLEQNRHEQDRREQIQADQQLTLEEERMRQEELRKQKYRLLEEDDQSPTLKSTNSQGPGVNAGKKRNTQLDVRKFLGSSRSDTPRGSGSQERPKSLNSASIGPLVQPREYTDASGLTGPTSQPIADFTSTSHQGLNTDARQHGDGQHEEEIPIRFQVRELDSWTTAPDCQQSRVERVAKDFMRSENKLFDTELQPVLPSNCLSGAIASGTYTILVIPETQMNIDDALVDSVEIIRAEALSRHKNANKRLATDDIAKFHHYRKKQIF